MVNFELAFGALKNVVWLDMNVLQTVFLLKILVELNELASVKMKVGPQKLLIFFLRRSYRIGVNILTIMIHLSCGPLKVLDERFRCCLTDAMITFGFNRWRSR